MKDLVITLAAKSRYDEEEKDYIFFITINNFIETKGTYSLQAETPDEYYGEFELDWEIGGVWIDREDDGGAGYSTHLKEEDFSQEVLDQLQQEVYDRLKYEQLLQRIEADYDNKGEFDYE